MRDRIRLLIEACGLNNVTCILIHKPANIYYLSGYTGEGLLLITPTLQAIVTDFRYVQQAAEQAPEFSVHAISSGMSHAMVAAGLLRQAGTEKALYEDDYVTVAGSRQFADALGVISLEPLNQAPEQLRRTKDSQELSFIEEACAISSRAFEDICGLIKPGMRETDIRRTLENLLLDYGALGMAFSTIVASGPNGALPHAIPGNRAVGIGDMITLDFGAKVQGYCADMTRTVALGQPNAKMRGIYELVLEAQVACQEALAPGKNNRDVDAIARRMIGDAGYGDMFGHGLGHSLGIDIHEDPRLNQTSVDVLEPGQILTVEPGIYLPGLGGVRIENTCCITQSGARSLIGASRELRIM
jgi:Xaa-Pro aminopeptidase